MIPELANRLDAQLVCLSTAKGKAGLVAQNVIRGARRPVLIMPAGD